MARKPFLQSTIKQLFGVAGNRCAFPGCHEPLIDPDTGQVLAEICHIKASSEDGPRYDRTQSDDDRRAAENLILMCAKHHKIIDGDPKTYTVEFLQSLKQEHEARNVGGTPPSDDVIHQFLFPPYIPPAPPDPGTLPDPGDLPPGSRLPLGRNALFTGRHRELLSLAEALLPAQPTDRFPVHLVICGLSGVGRIQLAVEFTYRYGRFFHSVHWLDLSQPHLISAEIAACGQAMLLPGWPQQQPAQVEMTLRAWHDGRSRLIILNNVEQAPEVVADQWLARLSGGGVRLLLTARRRGWPLRYGFRELLLGPFSPDESLRFLRRYLPPQRASDADLASLAERLGHLPLALQLAGRYLRRLRRRRVSDYLNELTEVVVDPVFDGLYGGLGACFAFSWAQVTDEDSRRLFLLAGFCAPNQPIPFELLERAAGLAQDTVDLSVSLLADLSLLSLDDDDPDRGPVMHPLVTDYARILASAAEEPVPNEGEAAFAPLPALAAALATLATEANQSGLPDRFALLRPHLESVASSAEIAELEPAGALWRELGFYLHDAAEYDSASEAFRRALVIDEAVRGPEHPNVAIDLSNMGRMLYREGDLAGARTAFERALSIDEAAFGPDHPRVASDINNLGHLFEVLGDLSKAHAAAGRVYSICKKWLPAEHPDILSARQRLQTLSEQIDQE